MNYVFPYINPDTDGVCASIAYSWLYPTFKPVIFGNFDKESLFVLTYFHVDLPKKVQKIGQKSKIALVDTHHIVQLPEINLLNVVEVIDHHPAGDSDKLINAKVQNEEVGSACTLLVERIRQEEKIPPSHIAGLLSLAIVSNTLNFTAPSTSKRDKDALVWLKALVPITDELILGMFKARSEISNIDTFDLLLSNNKIFEIEDYKVGLIQLELVEVEGLISRTDFIDSIINVKNKKGADFIIFSGVDILNHKTFIIVPEDEGRKLITNAMNINFLNNSAVVNRILLRKTDFVPQIQQYLKNK